MPLMIMIKRLGIITLSWFITLSASAAFLPPATGNAGMVVTDQKLATEVGVNILKAGGNAVDAAVAVGYALAVVEPCCGNLGGGGFMLIHLAKGPRNLIINFREKAPLAITPKVFLTKQGSINRHAKTGYLAVGVPGTVLGLNTALTKYGTLSLAQVMQPAIKLANQGFTLTDIGAYKLNNSYPYFMRQANLRAIFTHHGQRWSAGDRLVQKELAKTLSMISQQGSRAFYQGTIAKKLVTASQRHGGFLSLKDLQNYRVSIEKPLQCRYGAYDILTMPPPGSGLSVCEILAIVQAYPLTKLGFHSALTTHYNVEAMRFAYADRNHYLGDPKFIKIPIEKLLSQQHIAAIRKKISGHKAGDSKSIGWNKQFNNEKAETTHYVVMDKMGNIVSLTYTINGLFGARVMAGDTGFLLNNEMDDFTLNPGKPNMFQLVQGPANLIQGGKQPLSSMSPTLVLKNNKPYLALGAAGGSTIITSIVETIENVVDFAMDINAAVNQTRYQMQWLPDIVFMEPFAFSQDTLMKLWQMGYKTQLGFWVSPNGKSKLFKTWGQVAAILIDDSDKLIDGASDNRHPDGAAIGYNIKSLRAKPRVKAGGLQ